MKKVLFTCLRKTMELICKVCSIITPMIPKRENSILIYNSKPDYMNNYAIFKYLLKNKYNLKYKIYYSMPGIDKVISQEYRNVHFIKGYMKPLMVYLTVKHVFFDTGNMRIRPSKKQVVYNSWHGTPLKRIGFLSKNCEKSLPKNLMNTFTKISVSSKVLDEIYIKSFNIEKEQVIHIGQPRNDLLYQPLDNLDSLGIDAQKYDKIIIWMTTYRVSNDDRLVHTSNKNWSLTNIPILTDESRMKSFNKELLKLNQLVIIKIHGTSKLTNYEYRDLSNIKFIQEEDYILKGIQLYQILAMADVLITDYSSVYFDFLMLNRPIGFIIDDIDDYDRSNGFNFENVLEYMPGFKIANYEQLLNFFIQINQNIDSFVEERLKLNSIINEFTSKENTLNTLKYMGICKEEEE